MNGQILTKLENVEKELRDIKNLLKKRVGIPNDNRAELTLSEIAKRLKNVSKGISLKEIEEEIRAVRAKA